MNQRSLSVVTNSPNISRNWLSSAVMIMFFEILLLFNSLVDLLPSICGLKFVSSRDNIIQTECMFPAFRTSFSNFLSLYLLILVLLRLVWFVFTNLISNIANWCQVQWVEWVCRRKSQSERDGVRCNGGWSFFWRQTFTHSPRLAPRRYKLSCGTE